MNTDFYEEIKSAFAEIRFDPLGSIRAEITLKRAKKEINKEAETEDNKLLIYCIDTMFDILNERNEEKIYDFADMVHNIPEIMMGKRNFYSFAEEIEAFRSKYGEKYFSTFNMVKPRFTKYAPKNSLEYFLPNADDSFKAQHPVAYSWLRAAGVIFLFIPMIIYLVFCLLHPYVYNNGVVLLGHAGSVMVGIGLFNVVAAFVNQYMGHKMTLICLGGGSFLIALTWMLFYFVI